MSYGCAKRRDSRRTSAMTRMEASIEAQKHKLALHSKTKPAPAPFGLPPEEKAAIEKGLKSKIERAEECLKNTRANMGKGTCAMKKSERKSNKSEVEAV